jgi:hypothetical protein
MNVMRCDCIFNFLYLTMWSAFMASGVRHWSSFNWNVA